MSLYALHAWRGPWGTRENIGYPSSGATVCWEPFCEHWKLNSGSLQELQMFLTANPSLWHQNHKYINKQFTL